MNKNILLNFLLILTGVYMLSILPSPAKDLVTEQNTTETFKIQEGKYLFVCYWIHTEGTGNLPVIFIDFPTFSFDAETGNLKLHSRFAKDLTKYQLGFFGMGQSRSGAAGSGIASRLIPINYLPFTTVVFRFIDFEDEEEIYERIIFTIKQISMDGTIEVEIADMCLSLRAGEKWEHVVEKDVETSLGIGHIKVSHSLTNYGWLDRNKIVALTSYVFNQ